MLPAERLRKDLGRPCRGGAAPHNPGGNLRKLSGRRTSTPGPQGPCCSGSRAGLVGGSPSRPVPADGRSGWMSSARCRRAPEGDANLTMDIAVLGVLLRGTLTRSAGMNEHPAPPNAARFAPELRVAAARLSYLQDATQAEIADRLGPAARRSAGCSPKRAASASSASSSSNPPTAAWTSWHVVGLHHWASGRSGWSLRAPARRSVRRWPCGRPCWPHTCGRGTCCWSPRVGGCTRPPRLSFPSSPASSSCRRSGARTSLRRGS